MEISKTKAVGIVGAVVASLAALFAVSHDDYKHDPVRVLGAERLKPKDEKRVLGATNKTEKPQSAASAPVTAQVEQKADDFSKISKMDLRYVRFYMAKVLGNTGSLRDNIAYLSVIHESMSKDISKAGAVGMTPDALVQLMRKVGYEYLQELRTQGGVERILKNDKLSAYEKYDALQNVKIAYNFIGMDQKGLFSEQVASSYWQQDQGQQISNAALNEWFFELEKPAQKEAFEIMLRFDSGSNYSRKQLEDFIFTAQVAKIYSYKSISDPEEMEKRNDQKKRFREILLEIESRLNRAICDEAPVHSKPALEC